MKLKFTRTRRGSERSDGYSIYTVSLEQPARGHRNSRATVIATITEGRWTAPITRHRWDVEFACRPGRVEYFDDFADAKACVESAVFDAVVATLANG